MRGKGKKEEGLGSGPLKTGPLGLVRERDYEREGGSWQAAVRPRLNTPTRLGKEVKRRQTGAGVEGLRIGLRRSGPGGKRVRESEEGGIRASIC